MQTYTGNCHCKTITYTFESETISSGLSCNCSYCHKKASLLHFIPKKSFTLRSGADTLTEYRFNTLQIQHVFCKNCGVQCFGFGKIPNGEETVAINLNTVNEIDTQNLEIQRYNGKDA